MTRQRSLWKNVKGILRMKDQPLWIRIIIRTYIFVAIFAPLLANDEPVFISQNNEWSFPIFQNNAYVKLYENGEAKIVRRNAVDWKNIPAGTKIFTFIPYNPSSSDISNYNYVSPFDQQWSSAQSDSSINERLPIRFRHWLGTTKTGADVLAGIIHSTRLSLLIGILSMLIAGIIGIFMGALAGYYGDSGLRISKINIVISSLLIVPAWYYAFQFPERSIAMESATNIAEPDYFIPFKIILFIFILMLPFLLKHREVKKTKRDRTINFPVDSFISRFIELFLSIPRLILIITLAALSRPSVTSLILILGFTSWTGIARMIRAEFMRLKSSGFSEATHALGFSNFRKIFYHLLPNACIPIRVGLIFGIAGAILAEAGLSFLGIGLAPGTVSWGSLMAAGKEQFSAWWLVIFPGLSISVLLFVLNRIADQKNNIPQEKLL